MKISCPQYHIVSSERHIGGLPLERTRMITFHPQLARLAVKSISEATVDESELLESVTVYVLPDGHLFNIHGWGRKGMLLHQHVHKASREYLGSGANFGKWETISAPEFEVLEPMKELFESDLRAGEDGTFRVVISIGGKRFQIGTDVTAEEEAFNLAYLAGKDPVAVYDSQGEKIEEGVIFTSER